MHVISPSLAGHVFLVKAGPGSSYPWLEAIVKQRIPLAT